MYLRSGDAKPELRLRCIAATLPRKYFITSFAVVQVFSFLVYKKMNIIFCSH